MIPRLLNISKSQSFFLFGARATGKSTLLDHLFSAEEALTLNLLLPQDFDGLLRDPQSLVSIARELPKSKRWIIIDEVQKLPALLDVVHYCIEKHGVKFALTGSSARKLKRGRANLLGGRAFVFNLFPFTARELSELFSLEVALNFGTLPKIFEFDTDSDRELFLTGYAHTYIREEILAEQLVRDLPPFRKFLEIAAQMNSELVNFTSISREVGVDDKTVRSYFQILDDTLLGFFIDAYHRSIRKTQLQAPRFYFFDCGIKRAMQGALRSKLTPESYGYGKAFEHFIITEIFRLNSYLRKDFRLYYLRTQAGAEIDLIVERPTQSIALVEIKSAKIVRPDHVRELEEFSKDFNQPELLCLSLDPVPKMIGNVRCLPWQDGLKALGLE